MDDNKEKQRQAAIKGRSEGMWLTTTSLVILAGVALAFALAYTRAVMIPFVLALFIVTIVSPILDFQVLRLRIPRIIAVTVTLIVVVALIGLTGLLVTEVVGTVASTAGGYSQVVGVLLENGFNRFLEFVALFEEKNEGQAEEVNAVAEVNEPAKKQVVAKVISTKQEPVKQETAQVEPVKQETTKKESVQNPYFSKGGASVDPSNGSNEQPEVVSLIDGRLVLASHASNPVKSANDRVEREPLPAEAADANETEDYFPEVVRLIPGPGGKAVEVPSKDPNETLALAADMISQTTADSNELDSTFFSRTDVKQYINEFRAYIFKFGQGAIGATMGIISSSVFVVIFVIFLLSGRDPRVVRASIYDDIDHKIRRYICTKMAISAVTGVLVWFSLDRFGLTLAPLFGVLAFLLNFIPSIGSVISTMLPVPVAMAQMQVLKQALKDVDAKTLAIVDEANVRAQALVADANAVQDVNAFTQTFLSKAQTQAQALVADTPVVQDVNAFAQTLLNKAQIQAQALVADANVVQDVNAYAQTLLTSVQIHARALISENDLISEMITHNGVFFLILVIAVPGVIQFVMGSLIDPKLMGEGLNLHPVTILLALSFWGLLWGIVGMFLAAPITAAIRIILMQFETLKPFGQLLAGKLPEGNASSG
jgi:AI-2 transport protein TqsA